MRSIHTLLMKVLTIQIYIIYILSLSPLRSNAVFYLFSPNEQCGGGGGYDAARLFLLFSFTCSADHERDGPPCKVVFSGWQPIR